MFEGEIISATEVDSEFKPQVPEVAADDGSGLMLLDYGSQPVILPEGCTRADAIHVLSNNIPNNEFGLPTFFYRSDLLPYDLEGLTTGQVDAAAMKLSYSDGFPVFGLGIPYWNQLPHEPRDAYEMFRRYLEQAEEIGVRQLNLLAIDNRLSLEVVAEWAKEFLWSTRSRAHDLFVVAADRKLRENRIRRMEREHFRKASDLMDNLMEKFQDPEWWKGLEPDKAVGVLEKLIDIQRKSLGLTGQQSSTRPQDMAPGASMEVILRQVTQGAGLSSEAQQTAVPLLERMMHDPEFGVKAQELIIRAQMPSGGYTQGSADFG